jgi:hypothetical protein
MRTFDNRKPGFLMTREHRTHSQAAVLETTARTESHTQPSGGSWLGARRSAMAINVGQLATGLIGRTSAQPR